MNTAIEAQTSSQTTNLKVSQQDAAKILLARRKARKSFTEYCRYIAPLEPPAQHHRLLCDRLQDIVDGKITNLMVSMPPGSAKSTYCSVRFPTYFLGRFPKRDLIQASNTSELASRFGRKARNLIDTRRYSTLFDITLAKDSQAKNQWEVIPAGDDVGGEYYAIGVEGAVTGRRADGGIIDDPVKGREDADSQRMSDKVWDWYLTDFTTRIKPGGFKIIIQTRWSENDLSGRILPEEWKGESGPIVARDGEEWFVLSLPAQAIENDPLGRKPGEWLWLDWFTPEFWEQTKKRMPPRDWSALYQQTPTPEEGTYFKRDTFQRFRLGEEPDRLNRYLTSDFAVTDKQEADYTVFGDWGLDSDGHWWLLDRYKEQTTADKWGDTLTDWFKTRKPLKFFGESGVIKNAVEPFIKVLMRDKRAFTSMEWITRNRDKQAMASAFRGMCELGMIHIPLTEWGEDLLSTLLKFPGGANDDDVDMCALVGLAVDQGIDAPPKAPQPKEPARADYGSHEDKEDWKLM